MQITKYKQNLSALKPGQYSKFRYSVIHSVACHGKLYIVSRLKKQRGISQLNLCVLYWSIWQRATNKNFKTYLFSLLVLNHA